jgi:glutamate carboxypeptidase
VGGPFLERLRELVAIDSPTGDVEAADACVRLLAGWAERAGLEVELVPSPDGLHMIVSTAGRGPGRTLLIGHHDTVFPHGTAAARPLTVDGHRARGPGVADMKGGLLVGLLALERLAVDPTGPHGRVELHSVPDEEARMTAPHTLDRMRGATAAICLECGRSSGAIVSRRKAGTWIVLRARGRAAHAGTEPDQGRSALRALAHEALRIEAALHGARPELTATITQLHAGDVKNTVPDQAWATVDLRAGSADDLHWAIGEIGRFAAHDGVEVEHSDDPGFPPLVRADDLVERTLAVLRELGETAREETAGGVSDGSWASHVGVPTVDGMGPVGGLDHTADEYVELPSVPGRIEAVVRLCRAGSPRERGE